MEKMVWSIEKGLIVGANKNNRIYPEAKHIFEADGTIKIDDIIYEFNIDLNFSKLTSKKYKILISYENEEIFINAITSIAGKEYKLLINNNNFVDYVIVDKKWFFIDPSINEISIILNNLSIALNRNISFADYLKVVKELLILEIPFEDYVKKNIKKIQSNETKSEENYDILFPYQKQGVNWLNFMSNSKCGCILADSMGLGKTLQVIYALRHIKNINSDAHMLVVAPVSLLENWKREIGKFCPSLSVHVNYAKDRLFFYKELLNYDVIVTSYANVQTSYSMYKMIVWDAIVTDEAQNIKNPRAQRTQTLKELDKKFAIAVTGTPFENHLTDIYSIVDFVIPGYFGTLGEFEANYKDDLMSAEIIKDQINPIMIRRKVEEVKKDLPERFYIPVPIKMGINEAKYYDANINTIDMLKTTRIDLIQKLRCFCTHPSVYDKNYDDINPYKISSKYQRCCELIEEIIDNNEKVLIFTSFNKMSEILINDLSERFGVYVDYINGSINGQERQLKVDGFSNIEGPAILVLNPKAAGAGLNIISANHAIFYNSEWNPAIDDQASARIYRIGQDKPVFIYRLFYIDTIEEIINEKVQTKRELSDVAIVGNNGELNDIDRVLKLGQIGNLNGDTDEEN